MAFSKLKVFFGTDSLYVLMIPFQIVRNESLLQQGRMHIVFVVTVSGYYKVHVSDALSHVIGSPFRTEIFPLPPSSKTSVFVGTAVTIGTAGSRSIFFYFFPRCVFKQEIQFL